MTVLCPNCRRQNSPGASFCANCGTSLNGDGAVYELVLHDATRVPVVDGITIGRGAENTLRFDDETVSRNHARITPGVLGGPPSLEDAGSTYGTWLDGRRIDVPSLLGDGSRIKLGDEEVLVERRRESAEAGRTLVVPAGASLVMTTATGASALEPAPEHRGDRPRLRSGYALKRLEVGEGPRRWVLNDLRNGKFLRLSDDDATLLQLLDGRRDLTALTLAAEERLGAAGGARLARLLAGLDERDLLAGGNRPDGGPAAAPRGIFRPREATWAGAGELFDRIYAGGGWLLFARPAKLLLPLVAALGVFVFGYLVFGRYGTPFVVAHKIGLGGLVFVVGRFTVVAFHETAHGLAMASFGRRVRRAGLKLLLVFPYAYVDTSEMWFEPRRRRIAVSAAGPLSDLVLGALFSVSCLALAPGTVRDIFFQLAFGAYLGGLFNLNPTLDRDGYNILVDVLREPGLRRRAREQLRARLSGRSRGPGSPVLTRYALLSVAWTIVAAVFVGALSLRYLKPLSTATARPVAWMLLGCIWVVLFMPVLALLGRPLYDRLRYRLGRHR
jgi:putative peptide zinc metalloprotease protein